MSACAAFGPNDSHLFNSPRQWSMSGLPPDVNTLFNGQSKIKEVHEVALGPDGSYAITYSHHAGMSLLRAGLPAGLERWLVPVPGQGVSRDVPSLQMVLGPAGSYFAWDKNGSAWGSLPKPMNDAVEARRDQHGRFKTNEGPQSVALGPDGAYIFITTGGGGFWNLHGQNDVLQKFLAERKSLHGVFVTLSPCRPGIYIAFLTTGGCAASVPTSQFPQYEALAADWKVTCQSAPATVRAPIAQHTAPHAPVAQHAAPRAPVAHHAAPRPTMPHHRSSSISAGNVLQGLKLVNNIMKVADGNSSGGGQTFDTSDYSSGTDFFDTSNMFQTDQFAPSSPVQ